MNIVEAIKTRRSIRKFTGEAIKREILTDIVDCARLAPYPMNLQPLKFAIVTEKEKLNAVFPFTKWGGYLENGTPTLDERPAAYIMILGDRNIKSGDDFKKETGIAGATITAAAMEYGVATCWLGALDRAEISGILGLSQNLELQDIIALGYPAQKSEPVQIKSENVRYYLEKDTIKVPKRSIDEIIY